VTASEKDIARIDGQLRASNRPSVGLL